jgi:tRNA1(Val) A37 N6-methylase TrmN6
LNNTEYTILSESEWTELNSGLTIDEVKEIIWEKTRNLPMPTVYITEEECIEDFNKLKNLNTSELLVTGDIFSRYDYSHSIGTKYVDSSNVGNKSSNFFHQEQRFKCDSINSPSPERTWNTKKFFFSMLGALWTLKCKEVNSDTLRLCIAMRKYIASQFRPSAAKALYDHFGAKVVLDFSSGWGDRLSAAMATDTVTHYTGIDPNTVLFDGYNKQITKFGNGKDIEMYNSPAEDFLQNHGKKDYDFVFTSPPYFIIERYSKDDTQSWVRYKKINDWLEKFLFKTVKLSIDKLVSGGYIAINISDVYCNHTINRICDPMNDYIQNLGSMEKVENINYRMAKRINSKSGKNGVFVEPCWIWRKK